MKTAREFFYNCENDVFLRRCASKRPTRIEWNGDSELPGEIEAIWSKIRCDEKYQVLENENNDSCYVYRLFLQLVKGLKLEPYERLAKRSSELKFLYSRYEEDQITPVELLAVVGVLLYLAQDDASCCAEICTKLGLNDETIDELATLVHCNYSLPVLRGVDIELDERFCDDLCNVIGKLLVNGWKIQTLDGLSPLSFQLATDRSIMSKIMKVPGVKALCDSVTSVCKCQRELLLQANCIQVTPISNPRLYRIFAVACEILQVRNIPTFYINPRLSQIGAFVTGSSEEPMLVSSPQTSSLLEDRELLFLLGHNLGHALCGHTPVHFMADTLLDGADFFPVVGSFLSAISKPVLQPLLNVWFRQSELSADRAGLLCCQHREAALRALLKLGGLPLNCYETIRTRTLVDQARRFQKRTLERGLDSALKTINTLFASEPFLICRAGELLNWIETGAYEELLDVSPQERAEHGKRNDGDPYRLETINATERFVAEDFARRTGISKKAASRGVRQALFFTGKNVEPPCDHIFEIGSQTKMRDGSTYERYGYYKYFDGSQARLVSKILEGLSTSRDALSSQERSEFLRTGATEKTDVFYRAR